MAPLDLGCVGDAIQGAATTAINGAEGVASTAVDGAAGAATTAVKGAEGVATTVQGAVSTATSAVQGGLNDMNNAQGMLKWFEAVQNWITTIEGYWNEYKNLIIFIVCLIIAIYVICILYCCYHFVHDFCRCCCCYIKCTYHIERFCYRHCKSCINKHRQKHRHSNGDVDVEGGSHSCSQLCLKCIPSKTRKDLEKQHGDLSTGWFDPTYLARACGRYELPNDPVERSKWHWYGHEDTFIHRWVVSCLACLGTTMDKEKRIVKELRDAKNREKYWTKLYEGTENRVRRIGDDDWRDRVNEHWARGVGLADQLVKRMTAEEKKALKMAEQVLKRERERKTHVQSGPRTDADVEQTGEKGNYV